MRKITVLLLLALVVSLAACGGNSAPSAGGGDAAAGERVFNEVASPACGSCHSLEPGTVLVGPSLADIGAVAGSMVSGQSAEEYLHASIVAPNDYIVEGFNANLMPSTYGSQLTEQQVNDLVAYLLTLK